MRRTVNEVFVPITVGGGIRSVDDAREILSNGADKVAVNTAAMWRSELISEIAHKFGSQCLVLSVYAKRNNKGCWDALVDYGREHTNRDVIDWIKQGVSFGAGEVLLTSVDRDGTLQGFDIDLLKRVAIVYGFFYSRIRKVKPLLKAKNSQHSSAININIKGNSVSIIHRSGDRR